MSTDAPPQLAPRKRTIVTAASIYFALVFAVGLLAGPVRVMWIEPVLGTTIAVLLETPLLLAAMWFAARLAPHWAGASGGWLSYLAIGLIALALQQVADLAVGFGLRGMTVPAQLAYFATPPGWIYAFSLAAFALMPLIRRKKTPIEASMSKA